VVRIIRNVHAQAVEAELYHSYYTYQYNIIESVDSICRDSTDTQ